MFVAQGRGNITFSAVREEPEMHPLVELGISVSPYAAGLTALHYARQTPFGSDSKYSLFDVTQKVVRNLAEATPLSFGNTFRLPEMMSPYMSPKALGLDTTASVLDPSKQVASYTMDAKFFRNNDSKEMLKEIIGKDQYEKISQFMLGDSSDFRFLTEFEPEGKGPGRLIFQQLDRVVKNGEVDFVPKVGSEIDLGETRLISASYSNDVLSHFEDLNKKPSMNPYTQGVYQSLDPENVNYRNVFRSADGEILKYAPVPTMAGPLKSFGDLRRRTALGTGYLSMGINRFNRLISATFNQIPILGSTLEKAMDTDLPLIGKLSMKTKPGPFYKQFFSIGLKASKIGAVYMGVRTLDHYRRNFGVLGNMVASSAFAGVGAYLYGKYGKDVGPKGKVGMAAALFGGQMLLPGFDKGIVEGIATTAANIDVGLATIGKYTGLSYFRRGIEGLFPGFTDTSTGLFLGLGVAAMSYANFGENMLRRKALGESKGLDKFVSNLMPSAIRDRIGFISQDASGLPIKATSQVTKAKTYSGILDASKSLTGEYSENFLRYNPLAEQLTKLPSDSPLLREYSTKLAEVTEGKPFHEFSGEQIGKLKNFFNQNRDLFERIYTSDGRTLDKGEVYAARIDGNYTIQQKVKSNLYRQRYINSEMNESLLRRIGEINSRYQDPNMFENVLRRTEIFASEMYHSFFGATMEGNLTREIDGEVKEVSYDKLAKDLKATPIVKRLGALVLGTAFVHKALTSGFFGSMDDPKDLADEYAGKKLVEIKAGRFWEAGGTPYEGGETSYFRPSLYAMLMSNAAEKSVWGEDAERFNPISKFLLKNFTYYLEEKNYYDRPYPISSAAFKDIPVIGDLLSQTIGRIIKPPKLMHQDELVAYDEQGNKQIAFAEEMGSSLQTGEPKQAPVSPYSAMSMLGNLQYQFRELEGLTGFAKQTLQDKATGEKYLGTRNLLMAESNQMDSSIKDFWDMELGGMAFMSEPLRRLLPRERSEIERYNPILNTMPSYLPDRFKQGDPYRLIPNGFARLPGKGYEALNQDVAGLDPEDYPDIHKYKILSDVAPKSRLTMQLREKLFERRAAGVTTEHENAMLDQINEYHQKRLAATRDFKEENAIRTPFISDITSTIYGAGEQLTRKLLAPAEQAVPGLLGFGFRPGAKLLGNTRNAIEIYETERLYGTKNAFWDKPLRDSFRPALYSAANLMGFSGKPQFVKERNQLDDQFDKIEFVKFMRLAENADNIKDKNRYLSLASQTRTGVNPQGDALSIYLSLPNADKRFFDSFSKATGSDRERILEMVPEDQVNLYKAVWSRIDSGEGMTLFSNSKAKFDLDYMNAKFHQLESYFEENPMPGADWIGWHKDVDVEDIKVKYIQNLGAEIHDYDMWESQMRRVSRKPYLEGSDLFMYEDPNFHTSNLYTNTGIGAAKGLLNISNHPYENSRAEIFYKDNRSSELNNLLQGAIGG